MGCAYGTFIPSAAYRTIQQHCIEHREKWQPIAGFTVEEEGGVVLECSGGFQIVDYSPECGSEGIQLHLLGITVPTPSSFQTISRIDSWPNIPIAAQDA